MLFQQRDPILGAAVHGDLADLLDQLGAMRKPCGVGLIARILRPISHTGSVAEACELTIVADGQNHVAVGRREVLVGHRVRVRIAHALGHVAAVEVIHALVGQAGHLHVEQRQIDVLAAPGVLARLQRGEDGGAGI
ncbi:hypothetical protein SDC9_101272 [bioreactor metagenome]|uniref:Uncharacterized protein n=1 Tax=bioreactor metagenome TaxID=1076179 RepID=A0A645AY91_9ZZZZ